MFSFFYLTAKTWSQVYQQWGKQKKEIRRDSREGRREKSDLLKTYEKQELK